MNRLDIADCINDTCPWSGDPVQADSLTRYEGQVVGFCNTGCRDKFETALRHFEAAKGAGAGPAASGPSARASANPLTYEPRAVRFHGVLEVRGRRLKLYTLSAPGREPGALPPGRDLRHTLEAGLLDLGDEPDHGVGFAILHWAEDGDYLLINLWYDANMLRSSVFRIEARDARSPALASLAPLRVIACVWELDIYKFERDAWVREVLQKRPDSLTDAVLEPYLAVGLNGTV